MGVCHKGTKGSRHFVFNGFIEPASGHPVEIIYPLGTIGGSKAGIMTYDVLSEGIKILLK
jgi:hypothetical protein